MTTTLGRRAAMMLGRRAAMKLSRRAALKLSRRAALLMPLALAGCETLDDLFTTHKDPIPGARIAVMSAGEGLTLDPAMKGRVALPRPAERANAMQPGVTPDHVFGHPTLRDTLAQAWSSAIGEGGGYRRKILAQPVIADGRVVAMDSDGAVSAYDTRNGGRIWRVDTQADDSRSSNIGGGVAIDGGVVFAATGRGEMLALDAATGAIKWRKSLGTAARSAPTIAEGRVHVTTLDNQLITLAADDGRKLWSYQAPNGSTSLLGLPAPAVSEGTVIGGFGSGDLIALRAVSGAVVWSDSLASSRGRNSLLDLSTIHGMPVIVGNVVLAIGLGGLMIAIDLRSGRRLWERFIGSTETPCVAGNWVFVLTNDQILAAIDVAEGRVAWSSQMPKWERPEKQRDPITWVGPVLAGDRLLLGGSDSSAIAVSPYTGEILGQQKLSGKASVAPVVADNTAYVVTDDGRLIALR